MDVIGRNIHMIYLQFLPYLDGQMKTKFFNLIFENMRETEIFSYIYSKLFNSCQFTVCQFLSHSLLAYCLVKICTKAYGAFLSMQKMVW